MAAVVLIIALTAVWRINAAFGPRLEEQRRVMMDTYVTIYAYGPKRAVSSAIDRAFEAMQAEAKKLNAHDPSSQIHRFNQDGEPIRDPDIISLVRAALEVSRKSEGAFDITVYPLVKLWGFYEDLAKQVPPEERIREALGNTGYEHLIVKDGELRSDKDNINIDLAGIAKGYVVGQGIKTLKKYGIKSAIVQAGGDVYALGRKNGKAWKVGIRGYRGEGLLGYLEVEGLAVMGSGDYERFFVKDGKRYSHIIDPKTGHPSFGVSGVTVIYPDPAVADAWGTALFVLGREKGLRIVESIPGMEAVIVDEEGKVFYSAGLQQSLSMIHR